MRAAGSLWDAIRFARWRKGRLSAQREFGRQVPSARRKFCLSPSLCCIQARLAWFFQALLLLPTRGSATIAMSWPASKCELRASDEVPVMRGRFSPSCSGHRYRGKGCTSQPTLIVAASRLSAIIFDTKMVNSDGQRRPDTVKQGASARRASRGYLGLQRTRWRAH